MMFLSVPNFFSVNSPTDIPSGEYVQKISEYQNESGSLNTIYNEYFVDGETEPRACDLFVITPYGEVLFSDFIRRSDNAWRDCNGAVADNLLQLMPKEISDLRLISQEIGGRFLVHNGKITSL